MWCQAGQTDSSSCDKWRNISSTEQVFSVPISLQQDSRPQVFVLIPPVAGATGAAACAQDALIKPIELAAIFFCHRKLLARNPANQEWDKRGAHAAPPARLKQAICWGKRRHQRTAISCNTGIEHSLLYCPQRTHEHYLQAIESKDAKCCCKYELHLLVICLLLQIGLDRFVLSIEVAHVHNQVLDHKHVGQRGNLGDLGRIPIYFGQACQAISAINVHRA